MAGIVSNNSRFNGYYNNKKEGYYQNELSRKYGICGNPEDEYVIIDKEAVIGYENQQEKNSLLSPLQTNYKGILKKLSISNSKKFGKNREKRSVGNELDFLALDSHGDILLIEFKHGSGSNTEGIYLSPIQIGAYFDLWNQFPRSELEISISEMLIQKKKIGLINPSWNLPNLRNIVPVLIISNYNYKSSAKKKYQEVLEFVRTSKGEAFLSNMRTYNYTTEKGLFPW